VKARWQRDLNKERTKQKILAAALKLFATQRLAWNHDEGNLPKSGNRRGTLFNYFKTKEDLALYFFQKETYELEEWFHTEARLQRAPLPEKLFAIIHRQLEYIAPYEDFIGAVFFRSLQTKFQARSTQSRIAGTAAALPAFIRDVLAGAEEKKEIPRVGVLGACAVGLFYIGIVTHWLHDRSPRSKKRSPCWTVRCISQPTCSAKKGGTGEARAGTRSGPRVAPGANGRRDRRELSRLPGAESLFSTTRGRENGGRRCGAATRSRSGRSAGSARPIMKVGQAMSMQTHFFDPGVIEELAGLQMQAPPMHPTLMRAQFKGAMGKAARGSVSRIRLGTVRRGFTGTSALGRSTKERR
jgi:AcrR family transcriptional regulator